MRLSIVLALVAFTGCTARSQCDAVSLGQPVPASAQPVPALDSWCGSHPRRDFEATAGFADGGQLFSYGEFDEARTEQCCLAAEDGGVVAKWLGYD